MKYFMKDYVEDIDERFDTKNKTRLHHVHVKVDNVAAVDKSLSLVAMWSTMGCASM